MNKRSCTYIALLGMLSMPLGACGIKPGSLAPPAGAEDVVFPHTYPDPTTDPKPE